MDSSSFLVSMIAGALGAGYLFYGTHNRMIMATLSGIGLSVAPYFISNVWISIGVVVLFCYIPFKWRV